MGVDKTRRETHKRTKWAQAHDDEQRDRGAWIDAIRFGAVGIEFAVGATLGLLGGGWLDRRFGTGPWFMIGLLLFGVAAAFASLIHRAKEIERRFERDIAKKARSTDKKDNA